MDVKIRDNQTKKKIGKQILSSQWHLRHGCQFWESPHASPFRRESRSLVLKKLAIKKNSPDARCFGCIFCRCAFQTYPGANSQKVSLMVDLDFQGFFRKRLSIHFFNVATYHPPFEPSFVATTNNIVNETAKQSTEKRIFVNKKAFKSSWYFLGNLCWWVASLGVSITSLMSCHRGKWRRWHRKTDRPNIPKIAKNSPKNPQLQFTRQAASTTRKPSTTCSNSMSHQKQTSEKKNGWRIEFRNRLAAHHVGVNRNRFLPSTFDLAVTQRVRWWKLRPFHRNRTRGIDSARFFFFECLGDGCWKKPLASWKNVSQKKTDMHVGSIDFLL